MLQDEVERYEKLGDDSVTILLLQPLSQLMEISTIIYIGNAANSNDSRVNKNNSKINMTKYKHHSLNTKSIMIMKFQ